MQEVLWCRRCQEAAGKLNLAAADCAETRDTAAPPCKGAHARRQRVQGIFAGPLQCGHAYSVTPVEGQ